MSRRRLTSALAVALLFQGCVSRPGATTVGDGAVSSAFPRVYERVRDRRLGLEGHLATTPIGALEWRAWFAGEGLAAPALLQTPAGVAAAEQFFAVQYVGGGIVLALARDPATGRSSLWSIAIAQQPPSLTMVQRATYAGLDPGRIVYCSGGRYVALQERGSGALLAVPWPTPCRDLPTLDELAPPPRPSAFHGFDPWRDLDLGASHDGLFLWSHEGPSGRPFDQPRYHARWSPAAGWEIEWYFATEDPDAWVIS